MRLIEVAKMKVSGCKKCFSITYTLPCNIEKSLADYLISFGPIKYKLDVVKLLRIEQDETFIEAKIGTKTIKLGMPKERSKLVITKVPEKIKFEKALCEWLTVTLRFNITP
jgi:hypothetical protein